MGAGDSGRVSVKGNLSVGRRFEFQCRGRNRGCIDGVTSGAKALQWLSV